MQDIVAGPIDPTPHLIKLMSDVAPERASRLAQVLTQHSVAFAVNDQADRVLFRSHPRGNVIEVGLKCIWRLWASTYAYLCLYDELQLAKLSDANVLGLEFRSPRSKKAARMLQYAVTYDVAIRRGQTAPSEVTGLPNDLPRPFADAPHGSDEYAADQLCLKAIGYILHHELAHIYCGHKRCKGPDSIQQEKEADLQAAEWLLGNPALDPNVRLGRELAIAAGLGWLAAIDVYVRPSGTTHPPSYDRLYQIMDHYVVNKNSLVWALLAILLLLHLQNQNVDWGKDVAHDSWKSAVNYYVDVISRLRP